MSAEDLVLVERMPEQHRESHRDAHNWGRYPANGAERVVMTRADAEAACEGAEYDHVVRAATARDLERYPLEEA